MCFAILNHLVVGGHFLESLPHRSFVTGLSR